MQYNNNKTPFSAYSNQNNKKILDAIDELQEEVDTLSSSLDGVSSSLSSKADAQTTASSIQEINTNVSNLSNALTSLRDDIKSGDIGKIDDIEVDNISVNDEIKAKSYQWKEGEELSINKVLVPKNGSIYFVYSGIKTALIQYNASNNFIVLSSSNGFVKYGNYNNDIAFTVSESSYINYIGDISITTGNITNEVLTKVGTTVVGSLYASLQEANINNLTVANLSAEVIAGDEVRADNITADYVTVDEITADVGNIEDLESDSAKVKELNTSQINSKVDIENIGYTIIPEHQSGTDYLVVVPETNGTWNLELPGYFKATIIKTKDAAVVTYNRTSVVALSKIEVKYGRLYLFTEGYGKLYFANDSLENDNTVATYTENPPYTEPDETLELTSNNGTVNTTRAYFNNVTIYGSMSIRDYSADKINTSKNDTDDTFYPTFVDSNNENEDAEKLYTSTNLSLNPYEGKITTCIVCAADCVNTPLVNADLVCADICSDVININCLNSNTITNTGNVGTCNINVTSCATIRDLNVAEQTETGSLVVNNDAFIKGDLWVDGTTHTVDEETVTTQSDTIVLRANNNSSLGDNLSGIVINKYNGTDDLGIVTDADGTLRVGTGTGTITSYPAISYNSTTNKWYTDPTDLTTEVTPLGNLTSWATKTEDGPYTNYTNAVFTVFDKTSLEPVMTRDESTDMTDGQIICWDSTGNKAKTTNCISDNVTFAKCVDIECNLTVDNSICACCNVDTPTVNADNVNVCCCLTACNATFTDSVTVCNDFRVCGSAIIHGLTSDCVAVQENTSNHVMYPTFVCRNNAQQQGELMFTDCDLNYNPFTNTLTSPNIEFTNAHGNSINADVGISTGNLVVCSIFSPNCSGCFTNIEFYQHQNNDTYRKVACLECNTFKYEPLSCTDCCGKIQYMLSDNSTVVDQCNYVDRGCLHTRAVIANCGISCFSGIHTCYDINMYCEDWNCNTGYIYCDGSGCWDGEWCFCGGINSNTANVTSLSIGWCGGLNSEPNGNQPGWGNQTGTAIASWNDSTGGSMYFRRDNPTGGQLSMIIDGTVYVDEGRYGVIHEGNIGSQNVNHSNWANYKDYPTQNIDTTALDPDTWYPCVLQLSTHLPTNFWVMNALDGSSHPSWATHSAGFTAVLEGQAIGGGWGTHDGPAKIFYNQQKFYSGNKPVGYTYSNVSSWFIFYLRGGAIYHLSNDRGAIFTLYPNGITDDAGTNYGTRSSPLEDVSRTYIVANLDGTATCATNATQAYAVYDDRVQWDHNIVYSRMADNDFFRIRVGGNSNDGYVELSTADDGTEPIYVRQWTGEFATLVRTATLLDGYGNTYFPGRVEAGSLGFYTAGDATVNTFYSNNSTSSPVIVKIGGGALYMGESSIALGNGTGWSGSNCCVTSIGYSATASSYCSIAIGPYASAILPAATALGPNAHATGNSATALGPSAHANETLSIAIGPNATANRQYSVAIGNQAQTCAYGNNNTTFVDFCIRTEETRLKTVSWYTGTMQCDIFNAIAGGIDLTWVGGCDIPENDVNFATMGTFGNHEVSRFRFDKNESPRNIDFITNGQDTFCTIYEGCTATVNRPGMILVLGSR